MVEITLFEFNIDAEDLIANAPFSSGSDEADASPDDAGILSTGDDDAGLFSRGDEDAGDEGIGAADDGGPPLKPIAVGAGLLVLVLAVVAGRRLLGGEPEPLP